MIQLFGLVVDRNVFTILPISAGYWFITACREDTDDNDKLIAQGVKGMLSKGPDLRMEIVPTTENKYAIKVRASKGKKKNVFNDDIMITSTDAEKLKKYIKDNFMPFAISAK